MKISKAIGLIAAFSFTLGVAGASLADDKDRTREMSRDSDQDSLELREELRKNTALTDDDMTAISKELNEYARRTRDREQIRELVRNSLDEGCRGECLSEVIDAMNDSVKKGIGPGEAQAMVTETLRKEKMERKELSGKALGERVKERVEANIREMKRDRDRTMEKKEHRDRDMKKNMDSDSNGYGMGSGSGGGMGGGKGR